MVINNQLRMHKAYLTEAEAAEYLELNQGTLANWRMKGVGPAYSRLGRCVRYTVDNLDRYVVDHTFEPEQHNSEKARMK